MAKKGRNSKKLSQGISVEAAEVASREVSGERSVWRSVLHEYVALGIALLLVFRPMRDGVTYPSFNLYLMSIIWVLAILVLIPVFRRGQAIRCRIPLGLFAGYLLVAYFTGFASIQSDVSHRELVHQLSYLFLFFIVSNGIRTRLGLGIVLGAVVVSGFLEAIYSILHANFILPYVRQQIIDNPRLIVSYFHTETPELTAELKNRLEMQRAFGSFLFPNALGGYLVLCIPLLAGHILSVYRWFRDAWESGERPNTFWNSSFGALLTSILTGATFFIYVYGINFIMGFTRQDSSLLIEGVLANVFLEGVVPVAAAVGAWMVIRHRSAMALSTLCSFILLALAVIAEVYALWLSLSRGGILGLFAASLIAGILFIMGGRVRFFARPIKAIIAPLSVAVLVVFMAYPSSMLAQEVSDKGFEQPNLRHYFPFKSISFTADELDVTGRNLTMRDLGNMGSLKYRITYWNVGLVMAADNLFTGVGLNNFGTAYGKYQYLGAGDVKTAHNDYLQVLTESGLFGLLFFVAFWGYFLVWGGCRILLESNGQKRLILAGSYAGILAFLIHAFIDFHFTNAALAMMVYALAGLFYAYAYRDLDDLDLAKAKPFKTATLRIVAAGSIAVVLLGAGLTARLYLVDFALTKPTGTLYERIMYVGDLRHYSTKMEVASYFLHDLRDGVDLKRPPFRHISAVREFFHDVKDIQRLGPVRVPLSTDKGATRALGENEAVPSDAYIFIIHPEVGYDIARQESMRTINRLEEILALWPENTVVVNLLYDWNKLLAESAISQDDKLRFSEAGMKWAKRLVELSPEQAWNYFNYGSSIWLRADADLTARKVDLFREGLTMYRKSYELYPTSEALCRQYGDALLKMGGGFKVAKGLEAEGEEYIVEGHAYRERAHLISRYKTDVLGLR